MTEDEIVGWHHQLSGHEFEQAPGLGKLGMLQSVGLQSVGGQPGIVYSCQWASQVVH